MHTRSHTECKVVLQRDVPKRLPSLASGREENLIYLITIGQQALRLDARRIVAPIHLVAEQTQPGPMSLW